MNNNINNNINNSEVVKICPILQAGYIAHYGKSLEPINPQTCIGKACMFCDTYNSDCVIKHIHRRSY